MTLEMRDDVRDAIVSAIPMRRMAGAEEIASAVAFLAADENAYVIALFRFMFWRQVTGFRTKSPPRLSHHEKSVKPGTRRAFFCWEG